MPEHLRRAVRPHRPLLLEGRTRSRPGSRLLDVGTGAGAFAAAAMAAVVCGRRRPRGRHAAPGCDRRSQRVPGERRCPTCPSPTVRSTWAGNFVVNHVLTQAAAAELARVLARAAGWVSPCGPAGRPAAPPLGRRGARSQVCSAAERCAVAARPRLPTHHEGQPGHRRTPRLRPVERTSKVYEFTHVAEHVLRPICIAGLNQTRTGSAPHMSAGTDVAPPGLCPPG